MKSFRKDKKKHPDEDSARMPATQNGHCFLLLVFSFPLILPLIF